MINLENLQQALSKEVSRKEFFQHAGVFILGIIGVTGFISHFSKNLNLQPKQSANPIQSNGYGARPYGQ